MPQRSFDVSTSIVQVVPYNDRRLSLSFWNNGSATVFISVDPSNVAAQGFPMPTGAGLTFLQLDGDEPWLAYFAIADSGTQDVRISEGYGGIGAPFQQPSPLVNGV